MNDKIFFDTNILVYALGGKTGSTPDSRIEVARQLVISGGVTSVQVLNEFVQVCRRKAKLSWDRIVESLEVIKVLSGRAIPITMETHESAVDISRRYGFNIYDSLILAAAAEAGCTTLYTEDLQHGQVVEGVRVENPFLPPAIP